MAKLIPSIEQIEQLPTPLEPGERALMNALCQVLDDEWTIYVQPFLNGLKPDIIIFSEQAGLGIFEVKDWNLAHYLVHANGVWEVYDGRQQRWYASTTNCPLKQVTRYKDEIIRYELPELQAESVLNSSVYALVAPFVYFHAYTTAEAHDKVSPLISKYPHLTIFGHDSLEPQKLKAVLASRHLRRGSQFAAMMQKYQLQNRLRNALAYPEHGRLSVADILFTLIPEQQNLLANTPGKRRAIGAAGSGKTMILVRKAVNAALSGQRVLITCYNITMVNYINDMVRRLARHKDRSGQQISHRIFVRHYHRLFPKDGSGELRDKDVEMAMPFDVILIDEGQDFERGWIEKLYELANGEQSHILFVEDDRQNIYGKDTAARRKVPGIIGRPNILKRSFRINAEVAALANELINKSARQFESTDLEPVHAPTQLQLLAPPKPRWFDGSREEMLAALAKEVKRLINTPGSGAFADMVILVCTAEDGWAVCDQLDRLRLPYICNFESRADCERIRQLYPPEQFYRKRDDLRRGRKVAFRMQTGKIKICTIHSFKGWELKHVLVFYNPVSDEKSDNRVPLLYTAMTRTQESLTIFNAEPTLTRFGRLAAEMGLLAFRA